MNENPNMVNTNRAAADAALAVWLEMLNRPGLDGDLGYATSVVEATV
ncbi:hypothetical protein [Mycolicibacterium frederiksbergense]|nr:hypothetical protein [Mycolicibacterium frederiksbergense]